RRVPQGRRPLRRPDQHTRRRCVSPITETGLTTGRCAVRDRIAVVALMAVGSALLSPRTYGEPALRAGTAEQPGPWAGAREEHCLSGCCVVHRGVPSILYTSIGPRKRPDTGAEQWLATSRAGPQNGELLTWDKDPRNPVLTAAVHGGLKIRDWRDPFAWQQG